MTTPLQTIRRHIDAIPSHYGSPYDRSDYDKLTRLSYHGTQAQRTAIAARLLIDRQHDCRPFDNCLENSDAHEIIALLVDLAHTDPDLRDALCFAWSSQPRIHGLPACLVHTWEQQRTPLFASAAA